MVNLAETTLTGVSAFCGRGDTNNNQKGVAGLWE